MSGFGKVLTGCLGSMQLVMGLRQSLIVDPSCLNGQLPASLRCWNAR
jgi:hypothetical protein